MALYALGVAFLLYTLFQTLGDIGDLVKARNDYAQMQAFGGIALNFWGFVAGLAFAVVARNPFAWLNGKRLVIGCTVAAMLCGYVMMLTVGQLTLWFLQQFTPQSYGIPLTSPAGLLLALAYFLLLPLWMIFSGSALIIMLFTTAGGLFGIFVGVPVMLFKQILEFDHALHIYRYQARGLAAYIVRFVFWLRNETQPHVPDDTKGARFASQDEIVRLYDHARHGLWPCRRNAAPAAHRKACADYGLDALRQGRHAHHSASAALSRLGLRPRSQGRKRQGNGTATRSA